MADELREYMQMLERLDRVYRNLPNKAATLVVNFVKERFNAQNWVDSRTEPWKKRKVNRGSKRRQGRKILIDKSRLLRSIRKIEVTPYSATIGTDVPYAQIHNDGGKFSGNVTIKSHQRKAHTRKHGRKRERVKATTVSSHTRKMRWRMPRRQFIGPSVVLDKRIERMMTADINNALQST